MVDEEFRVFKIEYDWCDGEHEEVFVGKEVSREEFEKDLVKAREFALSLSGKEIEEYDYLGKGYTSECLPQYYKQILWFLETKLGYVCCYVDDTITYGVGTWGEDKLAIERKETKKERAVLK
jgi:hypothetical protein